MSATSANLLLAGAASQPAAGPLVSDPAGVLAVLLVVLAAIFLAGQHPAGARVFKYVPALLLCYFVPTTLTTLGVIPAASPLYDWVKDIVLPASLVLLILALDLPGIVRLGPKAVIMLLAGTAGVVIGGPVALWICRDMLPPDAWRGMSALSGSWIGGAANFVALGKMAGASDKMIATMVIPDVFVANCWMAVLLLASGFQHRIDRWTRADASAIRRLETRLTEFQQRVSRIPSLADLIVILAVGFAGSYFAKAGGGWLADHGAGLSPVTWKFIIVTALGVLISLTPARKLEGAGASKVGSVMIYLLVACIGAHADFTHLGEQPAWILMGFIWMAVHVIVLLGVGLLIRAPVFFVAVASQANIGGAASAPVVAAAFHPSLAPVGALLAVAGYVLGTYAGWLCLVMLKAIAAG